MVGNELINVRIAHVRRSDDAQQCPYRVRITGRRNNATQHARNRSVPHIDNLIRFHFKDFIALGNDIAFRFIPSGDGAFNHFNAPLGHGDGIDLAHNNTPSNSMRSGEGLFDRRSNFICIGQIRRLKFWRKGRWTMGRTDLFNGAF